VTRKGNRGSATDYTGGPYAAPLRSPAIHIDLRIDESCCERFGTLECVDCLLVEHVPECVPQCGGQDCSFCEQQWRCPCGNPPLRDKLHKEVTMTLVSALRG